MTLFIHYSTNSEEFIFVYKNLDNIKGKGNKNTRKRQQVSSEGDKCFQMEGGVKL
jgi:hypothetical protein